MRPKKRDYPNLLIVEGPDDKHAVIGLMKAHVDWPQAPESWPVFVEVGNGVAGILADGYLSTELKASHVRSVGVMLDADMNPDRRYERIRQLTAALFPDLPAAIPATGLIVDNEDGKRFGVWLMPDNQAVGDLETFLHYLVPGNQQRLWDFACNSVATARGIGAGCRDVHLTKANLYTWLSWQDPPGQSPGLALTRKILNPKSSYAGAFVGWFKDLFRLA